MSEFKADHEWEEGYRPVYEAERGRMSLPMTPLSALNPLQNVTHCRYCQVCGRVEQIYWSTTSHSAGWVRLFESFYA